MMQNATVRGFGQSSLASSFLSKSRVRNGGQDSKISKKSISLSDFLNRKVGKSDGKPIKEKQSPFSSIGFDKKELQSRKDEGGDGFVLDRAVFQRFNQPFMKESGGDEVVSLDSKGGCNDSKKRENPFGISAGEDEKPQSKKYLVVLGDDPKPKPKPKGRERKLLDEKPKPFYNHYENGSGWWDENREGVDNKEVGFNNVWEGMGSTTLGGLEWH